MKLRSKTKQTNETLLLQHTIVRFKVLVENGRKKAKFVKINEIEDLDSINAIKRKKHFEISSADDVINSPAYKRLNIQKE